MSTADSLIGFWREIERQGKKPTVATATRMARAIGFKVRDAEAYRILAKFRQMPGRDREDIRQSKISTVAEIWQESGRTRAAASRAPNKVSLVPNPSPVVLSEITSPQALPAKQLRLVDSTEERARAILAAFWTLVEPALQSNGHPAMTKTSWNSRNKRTALDLARCGHSVEALVAAHQAATVRMGSTVYSLRIVQDQLARPPDWKHGTTNANLHFEAETPPEEFASHIKITTA